MRRSMRLGAAMLVAVFGVSAEAAIASASSEGPAQHAASAGKKKKATITVKPSTKLTDGQQVTVTGKYHPKNASLGITECADKGDQTAAGDCNLGGIVPVKSNKKGEVKKKVTVALGPFGENNIVCTDTTTAPEGCLISLGPLAEGGQHPSKAIKFATS